LRVVLEAVRVLEVVRVIFQLDEVLDRAFEQGEFGA
jgi:hypothetical protein